jgi:hypothetical protein
MLNGLGNATADHLLDYDFSPGRPNQVAFNAALAVISGVQPKDEIEAMLAAHAPAPASGCRRSLPTM